MRTGFQFFGNNNHHQSAFLVNPAEIIKHTARFAILKLFFPVKLRRPNVLPEKSRNKTPHALCCCRGLRRLTNAFQPIKKTPATGRFFIGCFTWIRTKINGVRVRRSTVELFPNLRERRKAPAGERAYNQKIRECKYLIQKKFWKCQIRRLTGEKYGSAQFSVRKNGLLWFTPLFVVLVMIELSDLVFAVDSIPAIFAITTDPFIVFTSNIFAIMGLRALYFLLADWNERFHLLKFGLALVLLFVGAKMLLLEVYKIPTGISLAVVGLIIVGSMVISWVSSKPEHKDTP